MKKTSKILLCFLLLFFLFIPVCQGMPARTTSYKTIPIEQWERLKTNNNLLAAKLILLEMNLGALDKPTQELQMLLTQCRNDLATSQTRLQNAEASLAHVEALLKKTEESFRKLETQFEQERKEALKREREAYRKGWLNGFSAGGIGTALLLGFKG